MHRVRWKLLVHPSGRVVRRRASRIAPAGGGVSAMASSGLVAHARCPGAGAGGLPIGHGQAPLLIGLDFREHRSRFPCSCLAPLSPSDMPYVNYVLGPKSDEPAYAEGQLPSQLAGLGRRVCRSYHSNADINQIALSLSTGTQ